MDVQHVGLMTKKGGITLNFRLKDVREKNGITQEELAEKSGVSRATISLIENGRAECVKTDTLSKLADALGKKASDLFF